MMTSTVSYVCVSRTPHSKFYECWRYESEYSFKRFTSYGTCGNGISITEFLTSGSKYYARGIGSGYKITTNSFTYATSRVMMMMAMRKNII